MATASIYPDSTTLGDWTPTPAGADHHARLDDAGDTSDYIAVNGHAGGKIDILGYPVGPSNINYITSISLVCRVYGSNITEDPALRVELLVGGVVKGQVAVSAETGAAWLYLKFTFAGLFISKSDWENNPREIRVTPLSGASTLPLFEQE